MEEWKNIEDFPGYQVSNTGKIRSFMNNRHGIVKESHELKQIHNQRGYPTVMLGRGNRKLVSRLVAAAYIPNPNDLPLVRHMDDNPKNNEVDNLSWGTQADNMQDCVRRGRLAGDTSAAIESKRIAVNAISKNGEVIISFPSIQEAARQLNVWPQHICSVLQGRISQTGGYTFEYIDRGE